MSQESTEAPPQEPAGACRQDGSGWVTSLLGAFLPGALAGTQVAGLLFFLNPHLPFDSLSILRGVAFYGSLLGGAITSRTMRIARSSSTHPVKSPTSSRANVE